jgi:hypothetical protein
MPTPSSADAAPVVRQADDALAYIEGKLPGIDAISAMGNQRYRANGDLYDVMDIGWRMLPSLVADFAANVDGAENVASQLSVTENIYYSHPDASKNWPHIALHEIVVKANKVLSIYAGLPVVARYYTDPGAPPPPLPPTME